MGLAGRRRRRRRSAARLDQGAGDHARGLRARPEGRRPHDVPPARRRRASPACRCPSPEAATASAAGAERRRPPRAAATARRPSRSSSSSSAHAALEASRTGAAAAAASARPAGATPPASGAADQAAAPRRRRHGPGAPRRLLSSRRRHLTRPRRPRGHPVTRSTRLLIAGAARRRGRGRLLVPGARAQARGGRQARHGGRPAGGRSHAGRAAGPDVHEGQGQLPRRTTRRVARLGKAVPADDDVRSLLVQLDSAAKRAKVDFRSITLSGGASARRDPAAAARRRRRAGARTGRRARRQRRLLGDALQLRVQRQLLPACRTSSADSSASSPCRTTTIDVTGRLLRLESIARHRRRRRPEQAPGAGRRLHLPGPARPRASPRAPRPRPGRDDAGVHRARGRRYRLHSHRDDHWSPMTAVTNLWRQLVQRRLWPVAILLIAALVAVPLMLAKDPEPAPAPPPAQVDDQERARDDADRGAGDRRRTAPSAARCSASPRTRSASPKAAATGAGDADGPVVQKTDTGGASTGPVVRRLRLRQRHVADADEHDPEHARHAGSRRRSTTRRRS